MEGRSEILKRNFTWIGSIDIFFSFLFFFFSPLKYRFYIDISSEHESYITLNIDIIIETLLKI